MGVCVCGGEKGYGYASMAGMCPCRFAVGYHGRLECHPIHLARMYVCDVCACVCVCVCRQRWDMLFSKLGVL